MSAADKYPSSLSGGMVKRAALARALALDPDILFFDEPSAGLDPLSSAHLDELILELRDSLGATIVIVTHEMSVIRRICNRVALLDDGHLVEVVQVENKQLHPQSVVGQELVRED